MNGDVGMQYCGVCPPSTPDISTSAMAVESPVEAPAASSPPTSSSSPADSPPGAAVSGESPPLSKAPSVGPETIEEMAASPSTPASVSVGEQEWTPSTEEGVPLASNQQNGVVTSLAGDSSQTTTTTTSAPLLPTPPQPSPVPPQSDTALPETSSGPSPTESAEERTDGKSELSAASETTQGTQTTPAQTPTPATTPAATPVAQPQQASQQPLTREEIQHLVAQQVEYFFSRENLSNDPYLISQMDSDQYVPVFILANCSQFKNITNDHSIIVEALKESPYVQLDEENNRVRPNYKRCIVILREIPESTPVEEIEAVFKSDDCPKVVSCEFVHNSSWYVTFESDEDAQKAYWFLRGTVQTFKGKPILARIKTKPISRLGCLSVLPSYGGKGGNEAKDGSAPPHTPGSAGLPSGPGTPQQNANYNTPAGQRFMYSPPTSVNTNSFTHTYTMPTNMPTAFFYPNMVQWAPPGGFYDINGFFQINGLSPQAAFKPPTSNPNVRYPNRRKRDGNRFDKGDNRHGNNQGGPNNNQSGHVVGHYHPNQRYHRPQSSQSPSLSHRTGHPPPTSNGGPVPPPPPPPPPSSSTSSSHTAPASSGVGTGNHHSFAQSDLALASQSDLYTSFSPPIVSSLHAIRDKKETVTVSKSASSSSSSSTTSGNSTSQPAGAPSSNNPPSSNVSMLNTTTTSTANSSSAAGSSTTSAVTAATSSSNMQIPSPHLQGQPLPPSQHHHMQQQPSGPSHRGSYNNDHYHHYHHHYHHGMAREPQPNRQLMRGGRRRPRGRDEEASMMGGNGRGMPMRGNASQMPVAENKSGSNSQESTPPPVPQPQFDLQATAFPPLPGADEQVPVMEEKRPAEPIASPWGSDTQRFSDVMKGTAKPRPTSQSSEKDLPQESSSATTSTTSTPAPPSTSVASSPSPTVTAAPTVVAAAAAPQASQVSSSTSTTTTSAQQVSTVVPVSSVNTTSSVPVTTTQSGSTSVSQPSTSSSKQNDTRLLPREQRGGRDDRRVGASGGGSHRDRRDYVRDHPRDYQRDMMRSGNNVRDRDYHRLGREGSLRSGKENRPIPSRQWKEEKADAEGWITKGPREPRFPRETNREQRERPESKETRTPLVNGDSSPPPSPKAPKTDAKLNNEENNTDFKCTQSLNNNDGEHKTSWAKMALASKDQMERLAAELKEKEEQEKKLRFHTRPQAKPQDKVLIPRERDGKPLRRDGPPRENRVSSERGPIPFRPRDSARPKSPK